MIKKTVMAYLLFSEIGELASINFNTLKNILGDLWSKTHVMLTTIEK